VRDIPREELAGLANRRQTCAPPTRHPAQLTVVAWPDPVVDALGFLPHDPYSELTGTQERFVRVV
jgi:hypothetical protein